MEWVKRKQITAIIKDCVQRINENWDKERCNLNLNAVSLANEFESRTGLKAGIVLNFFEQVDRSARGRFVCYGRSRLIDGWNRGVKYWFFPRLPKDLK